MADAKKLTWDEIENRRYETGVDQVVLFPMTNNAYGDGVAWNGVTSIEESPSGAEAAAQYADNIKYFNLVSAEEFGCSIEAFQSPEEFDECDGSATFAAGVTIGQQPRKTFGLAYRTKIGDYDSDSAGYKYHLVYGCKAAPSSKSYGTVNESPEAMTLSWEVTTTPIDVPGFKATATVVVDSTKVTESQLNAFLTKLYGKDPVYDTDGETVTTPGVAAKLPMPSDLATIFAAG